MLFSSCAVAVVVAGVASAADTVPTFVAAQGPPRAGSLFVGVTVTFHASGPRDISCDAHLGGRVVHPPGALAFAGGVWLRPILRERLVQPSVGHAAWVASATCAWQIPRGAAGQLLSLLPPPQDVPCDTSCPPTGVYVSDSSGETWFNQDTWRVAKSSQ